MGFGILKGIQAHSMAGTHISGLGCVFFFFFRSTPMGRIRQAVYFYLLIAFGISLTM